MGICLKCEPNADVPDEEILDHVRVMHPDLYGDGPERWPDGKVVVHYADPTPEDVTRER